MGETSMTVLEAVSHRIEQKMQVIAGQLTSGQVETFPDYKKKVGQIRGLADAKDILADTIKEVYADE